LAATCLFEDAALGQVVTGSAAVALATLAMTVTDTEHAPAAGSALAMVLNRGQLLLAVAAVAAGSVFLALTGRIARRWTRDLT
jgi:CBS-domain-containing membrane protein